MAKRKRANSTSEESPVTETTHFSDLNDDCLRAVLSFLPTNDLCAMKEANKRFAELADDEFRARYRHQPYIFGPKFDDFADRADFSSAIKVVRRFGQFITALSVHSVIEETDWYIWAEIFVSCSVLSELKIYGCALKHIFFQADGRMALESLQFRNCTGNDDQYTRVINSFENVKRLVIECCYDRFTGGFLKQQYPALEEITIRRIGIHRPTLCKLNSRLRLFIRSHAHLKKIDFSFHRIEEKTLRCIADHSENVENLSFNIEHCERFEEIWPKLIRFNLKELNFTPPSPGTGVGQFIEALAERNELHTVCVSGGYMTLELYAAISKLTNLKTLKFVDHCNQEDEVFDLGFVWEKLELEHLHLISCRRMEYEHCTSAITKMKSLKSLTFVPRFMVCSAHEDRNRLDDVLPRWINARKSANSDSPLKIFLSPEDLDLVPEKFAHPKQNAISIQWKHGVSENEYHRSVIDHDLL